MSIIKKAQKRAEKEAKRAIQYPRSEPVAQCPEPENTVELSYRELQAKAKGLGLKANGSKKDLLERLA